MKWVAHAAQMAPYTTVGPAAETGFGQLVEQLTGMRIVVGGCRPRMIVVAMDTPSEMTPFQEYRSPAQPIGYSGMVQVYMAEKETAVNSGMTGLAGEKVVDWRVGEVSEDWSYSCLEWSCESFELLKISRRNWKRWRINAVRSSFPEYLGRSE